MLPQVLGYAGGLYVARNLLRDRLDEIREKLEVERAAKESLQRRFQQTQDDTSYTVLALLPTLSEQILRAMDIEALTDELQSRAKPRNSVQTLQLGDHTSTSPLTLVSVSLMSAGSSGTQSWVEAPAESISRPVHSPAPSASASSSIAESLDDNRQLGAREDHLAESIISIASSISSSASDSTNMKSKPQLWNEVKLLTFTRTLTTLYSTTLLCLLTSLQLTFLSRSKYVAAVLTQEQEERVQEQLESELTTSNLVFGSFGLGPAAGSRLETLLSGGIIDQGDNGKHSGGLWSWEGINEEVESKYLTLSWWLLHVGWKGVSERVQRAVEETFEGVSLKTKLAVIDLHRLIRDVRRRVEYEIVFGGKEKTADFLSSLLPTTPEMIHHVLSHGGYRPSGSAKACGTSQSHQPGQHSDNLTNLSQEARGSRFSPATPHLALHEEPFSDLLSETREVLSSPDFARVLEVCLDYATEILLESLAKNVFEPNRDPTGTTEPRVKLAGLLPALSKWSRLALDGLPNELVDRLLALREVSCLAAVVFSKFEEQFL